MKQRQIHNLEVAELWSLLRSRAEGLRPDEVAPFQAAMRGSGFPDFRVWPEGDRPFYSSIAMLEPLDWRNRRAIGYDMFSEPVRRAEAESDVACG